jgi:GrpB-like predicted nucleotidyltransferase (UPF0157 family)
MRRLDGPIAFCDYDAAWPARFAAEAKRIRAALGERATLVEHVGSTSVPGMAAKPVVDIVLAVPDAAAERDYVPALEATGYRVHSASPSGTITASSNHPTAA